MAASASIGVRESPFHALQSPTQHPDGEEEPLPPRSTTGDSWEKRLGGCSIRKVAGSGRSRPLKQTGPVWSLTARQRRPGRRSGPP